MPNRGPAARRGIPPSGIDAAIKSVVARHRLNAFQGNCADFAIALNRALGGDGTYLAADSGDHYEYVDHVALRFRGRIYDGDGLISRDDLREYARNEDDGFAGASVTEVDEDVARRLVDPGAMGACIDVELTAERLREALARELGRAPPGAEPEGTAPGGP